VLPVNTGTSFTPSIISAFTLKAVIAGIELDVVCKALGGSGTTTNREPKEGEMRVEGSKITLKFTSCEVTKPAGKGCKVKEPFEMTGLKSTTLAVAEAEPAKVEFAPESGTELGAIVLEGCSLSALNGSKPVTGTIVGVGSNEDFSLLEFTAGSGSAVKLGGQSAVFTGSSRDFLAGTEERLAIENP